MRTVVGVVAVPPVGVSRLSRALPVRVLVCSPSVKDVPVLSASVKSSRTSIQSKRIAKFLCQHKSSIRKPS